MLKTPLEWLETPRFKGIVIMDADGWRDMTWDNAIDEKDFENRLIQCTCLFNSGMVNLRGSR
jgi:hypothetical protein